MRYVKKSTCFFLSTLLFSIPMLASADMPPNLNKISYQQAIEKWATTTTAKVTVNVDAALDKIGLADINTHVLDNLKKMAAQGDWHITQFSRGEDKSGLEIVHVEAEARLPGSSLADLRTKAKAASKAGETYTVSDIDFSPSAVEMENAHVAARNEIYNNVKQEIARLNQVYPDQHYFLFALDFQPSQVMPMMKTQMAVAAMAPGMEGARPAAVVMPINAKIVESAAIVIAAVTPTASTPPTAVAKP